MAAIQLDLRRGDYQDDGASPWYCVIAVGSQPTMMKLSLDTGTNMNWLTSTQCSTQACMMPGRVRFDPSSSSTFQWVDENTQLNLNYGPWGTLKANLGKDKLNMTAFAGLDAITMGLAIDYRGEKFDEVDWDGCLAFPTKGQMQHGMSFLFQDLMDSKILGAGETYFSYETDPVTKTGTCTLGGLDATKIDPSSMLILPFDAYLPSVEYIWSTPLQSASFGGTNIAQDATFCLDTGSSRFKGDGTYMNTILGLAANFPGADLELEVGTANGGRPGKLVVPPSIYNQKIEKGNNAGKSMPQFHELAGLKGLFLAGSILMDHLYTVYWYEEVPTPSGGRALEPKGMVIFNRKNGPRIIQNGLPYTGDSTDFVQTVTALVADSKGA